jgi:hypothetical protein
MYEGMIIKVGMSWVDIGANSRMDIEVETTMLVFVVSIGRHLGLIYSASLGGSVQLFLLAFPDQVSKVTSLANHGDRLSY